MVFIPFSSLYSARSTHSVTFKLIMFMLRRVLSTLHGFPLVMASAGLALPLIYFTSAISLRLYN